MPDPTPGVDPQPVVDPQPSPVDPPTPQPNPSTDLPTDTATLHGMIRDLRRENGNARVKNKELADQVADLEGKFSTANGNSQELLKAKNDKIQQLETELTTAKDQLAGYKDIEEQQRKDLVNQLPESLRDRYKDTPSNVLKNLVDDLKTTRQPTPDIDNPAGSGSTGDLTLDEALTTGDDARINAAFDKALS